MKLPDSHQLQQEDFMYITDTWKMEWEKGVQVPVAIDSIPPIKCEELREPPAGTFKLWVTWQSPRLGRLHKIKCTTQCKQNRRGWLTLESPIELVKSPPWAYWQRCQCSVLKRNSVFCQSFHFFPVLLYTFSGWFGEFNNILCDFSFLDYFQFFLE